MSGGALQFEIGDGGGARKLDRLRVGGGVKALFRNTGTTTRIGRLEERDGYRMRLPAHTGRCEGVIINTGGGIAGGDRVVMAMTVAAGAEAVVTTQSAERVYRALPGSEAHLDAAFGVAKGASLAWLPQETILFDGARLVRRIEADVDPSGRLLVCEMTVLGRPAHGEALTRGRFIDHWRIRRGGRLALAESTRLDGDLAGLIARPGALGGQRAFALVVLVSPDAEERLATVRDRPVPPGCRLAASAFDGLLIARLAAAAIAPAKAAAASAIEAMAGLVAPRVWQL